MKLDGAASEQIFVALSPFLRIGDRDPADDAFGAYRVGPNREIFGEVSDHVRRMIENGHIRLPEEEYARRLRMRRLAKVAASHVSWANVAKGCGFASGADICRALISIQADSDWPYRRIGDLQILLEFCAKEKFFSPRLA